MFNGSITALVTPFINGGIDEERLKELVEFNITNGTSAIVSCGTTGEAATMSHEEDYNVTKTVVEMSKGRIPVIAGTGSNNYTEALYLTEMAKKNGADAALIVTPYYNKPTQDGLYQHYKRLAESVDIPIILYNVPGRTAVNMSPETTVKLAKIPNIVALKDASGSLNNIMQITKMDPTFTVLSGDDALTYPMMALGAKGVISVTSNIIPGAMAKLCAHMLKGEYKQGRDIHYKYLDLFDALFFESNPIPVKAALHMMGMIGEEIRLPLLPMTDANKSKLRDVMQRLGLKV